MSKLQKSLTQWAAILGLVLAFSVRPALAQTSSPSPQASDNQSDTEKKKSKKSKKEKASGTKSEENASSGAPSAPTKTGETSKPVESKQASPETGKTSSAAGSAPSKPAAGNKSEAGPVSQAEISSAQASGKVWVNLDSGIYHKGGQYYGHTKNGKFMTEAEAQKAGYREAKNEAKK